MDLYTHTCTQNLQQITTDQCFHCDSEPSSSSLILPRCIAMVTYQSPWQQSQAEENANCLLLQPYILKAMIHGQHTEKHSGKHTGNCTNIWSSIKGSFQVRSRPQYWHSRSHLHALLQKLRHNDAAPFCIQKQIKAFNLEGCTIKVHHNMLKHCEHQKASTSK